MAWGRCLHLVLAIGLAARVLATSLGPGKLEAIAIYEVQNGRISKVWLIYGARAIPGAKQ